MTKEKIERSEAILRKKRNTRKGLKVRNKILIFLNNHPNDSFTISNISDEVAFSYPTVYYHLNSMMEENIVTKNVVNRISYWKITGYGQQTIKNWLKSNNKI